MDLPPVVAVEVGTCKVVALVGEMREDGNIMITGVGHYPSSGIRKGEAAEIESAQVCVCGALSAAEEMSKVTISHVHLVVTGTHFQTAVNRGSTPVLQPNEGITDAEVSQVMDVARGVKLPADRVALHTICQRFYIDDEPVVRPEGFEGGKLTLDMLIVHALRVRLRNAIRVVSGVKVKVCDTAFSGLCAGLAVLTPQQKESGALVIDLGGGTTDYIAYAGSVLAATGVVGVGGDHITNDIALAFKIAHRQAEQLKKEVGSALVDETQFNRRIAVPAEDGFRGATLNLGSLHTVINARAGETLAIVRERLGAEGVLPHIGSGILLTGGGARLREIVPLAEKIFGLPCMVGQAWGFSGQEMATEAPEYAAPLGMIRYGFRTAIQRGGRTWGEKVREVIEEIIGRHE